MERSDCPYLALSSATLCRLRSEFPGPSRQSPQAFFVDRVRSHFRLGASFFLSARSFAVFLVRLMKHLPQVVWYRELCLYQKAAWTLMHFPFLQVASLCFLTLFFSFGNDWW